MLDEIVVSASDRVSWMCCRDFACCCACCRRSSSRHPRRQAQQVSSQCRRASAHHHRNHNRRSRAAAPAPVPSPAAVVAAAALAMARAFSGDDVAVAADAAAHCCPARSQYLADRWPAVAVVVAAAGVLHAPAAAVVALHHPGKATLLPLDNTHVCAARSLLMRKTCSGAACHRSEWPQKPLHRHCHCRSVSPLCV